jgi:predicted porin
MNSYVKTTRMLVAGIGVAACTAVQAADPLPDSFTLAGVTLYATIDVGYAYQSEGVPLSGKYLGGLEYQAFTTTRNFSGSQSTLAESGIEQSKVGIRVDLPVGFDLNMVGRAETGFNPLSGELTDACGSIVDNSGVAQGKQTANADSSRCGQAFNGVAFGGLSHKVYGTLTIGRQQSLQLDALAVYDPQTLSYAFSFLGYSGFDAGAGSTEAARLDNSVKYAVQNGPAHAAVVYSNGGVDTGVFGHSYGIDLGAAFAGLSVDAVYEKENGAVNLRSAFDNPVNPVPTPGLAAYASNDTSWNLMGKYTFDLGGGAKGADGKSAPADRLSVYAGYSHIQKAHSDVTGGSAQGDYPLDIDININNSAEYSLEWLGAKYLMHSGWSFTGALYHVSQNSWTIGLGPAGTQGVGCSAAGLLCSGTFSEGSVTADYTFNKHHDAYVGVNYSHVTDGLANGFAGTTSNGTTGSESQTTLMIGYRLRL